MDDKPGLLPELIIPVAGLGFAGYYLSTVWTLPFQAKIVGLFLAACLLLLAAILGLRFAAEFRGRRKSLSFQGFFSRPEYEVRRYAVLGAAVLMVALMPVLGFTVALFLFVAATTLAVGGLSRLPVALITAAALTAIAFGVFIVAVEVRFPLTVVDRTLLAWVTPS